MLYIRQIENDLFFIRNLNKSENIYASSWMRLVSTATPSSGSFLGLATAVGGRLSGGLSSGGFECIKMNGSSATKSLKWRQRNKTNQLNQSEMSVIRNLPAQSSQAELNFHFVLHDDAKIFFLHRFCQTVMRKTIWNRSRQQQLIFG